MEESGRRNPLQLLAILIAAVLQGWALYGLHWSIDHERWPATDNGWLLGLYAFWVIAPLSVQMLAEWLRQRASWVVVVLVSLVFFYFGWHHGSAIAPPPGTPEFNQGDMYFLPMFAVPVLWLMLVPFLQTRLANGRWRGSYTEYFHNAWHNKLRLGEAALFTGVFWLLLGLWASLFRLLGSRFFTELFTEPVFAYPVTALAFGIALHLIGSQRRLVTVVLEQLLGLLKWLAVVAGLILLLFTIALLPKLPDLFADGQRPLNTLWLLWLLAVMVLLLNAAWRDGSGERPYPAALALALRCVVPLMSIIGLVAVYALGLRIAAFGFTVERIWGLLVAVAALAYALGYGFAAIRSGPWMAAMGRINVGVALGLIVLISLMLTPLLSPWRLAANSQHRVALESTDEGRSLDAMRYLRFEAGGYGTSRLEQLGELADHPQAALLRDQVRRVLAMQRRWDQLPVDPVAWLERLALHPAGRTVDDALRGTLTDTAADDRQAQPGLACAVAQDRCAGLFIDLDADGSDEFVVLARGSSFIYGQRDGGWQLRGRAASGGLNDRAWQDVLESLGQGSYGTVPPQWQDLRIGELTLEINSVPAP